MKSVKLQSFSGSHYEIGIQQGKAIQELLKKALSQASKLETVKIVKPKLLPTALFLALAKRRAKRQLGKDIRKYYPLQAEKLEGMAEGASADIPTLLLLQAIELLFNIRQSDYYLQACTSIGINPKQSTTNETIIAKNFDYPNEFSAYCSTFHTGPSKRYQTLGCTMAPLAGILDGMNEHGLSVTYNLAHGFDKPKYFIPISIVLQEMLETCKNTDEAISFLTKAKHAGNAILMIADADFNLKTIEMSSNNVAVRKLNNSYMINTNHYLDSNMQRIEIPKKAVFSGKSPKELHGVRVHESSERRLNRAKELLESKQKLDEENLIDILKDHGKDNKPSTFTICRHDNYTSTMRSVIIYPYRKIIKVLYGKPCQSKYSDFTFP